VTKHKGYVGKESVRLKTPNAMTQILWMNWSSSTAPISETQKARKKIVEDFRAQTLLHKNNAELDPMRPSIRVTCNE